MVILRGARSDSGFVNTCLRDFRGEVVWIEAEGELDGEVEEDVKLSSVSTGRAVEGHLLLGDIAGSTASMLGGKRR